MNGVYGPKESNFTTIPENVRKAATQEANRLGYSMPMIVRYSNHPDDNYLYIVMGKLKSGRETYAVWTLNAIPGMFGFNNGYYDLDFKTAINRLASLVVYHSRG